MINIQHVKVEVKVRYAEWLLCESNLDVTNNCWTELSCSMFALIWSHFCSWEILQNTRFWHSGSLVDSMTCEYYAVFDLTRKVESLDSESCNLHAWYGWDKSFSRAGRLHSGNNWKAVNLETDVTVVKRL